MTSRRLKNVIMGTACMAGVDTLFRYLNRSKLLVVMYHGVSLHKYPNIWDQVPAETFKTHLKFLNSHYKFVTLTDVVNSIRNHVPLPGRAALLTFDDGLKNNYAVAFPILREMGIPAAVFLTTEFIGTDRMLWFDELFFLLQEAAMLGVDLNLPQKAANQFLNKGNVWESYEIVVENLKRSGPVRRWDEMERLKNLVQFDHRLYQDDFGLMQWDEIRAMLESGLIEFGVHTATHRIITEITDDEWDKEITASKFKLENELGVEAAAFCYPNGKPSMDFRREHFGRLRQAGYVCAFTTESTLFPLNHGNCMAIGRIPAGNDVSSDAGYFRISTSGALRFIRNRINNIKSSEKLHPEESVNERSEHGITV
jgi:peptidoglycan/xylan/chitin deacetylase (PgdA/CDA1 family)